MKDITALEYQEFYEYITNTKGPYKYKSHFKTDLPIELTGLIFIPNSHSETFGSSQMDTDLFL